MKKWITLILSVVLSLSLFGITLEESIDLARQNNKDLLMAEMEVSKADNTYYDVRGTLLPQISLQGGYSLSKTHLPNKVKNASIPSVSQMLDPDQATQSDWMIAGVLDGITAGMVPSSPKEEGSLAMQLKMDQVLFLGGKLINGIKGVDRYRSIQRLQYSVKEQDVILQTTQLFYATLLAKKVVEIQEEALATARAHLNRVQIFESEGQVSEFDLLRAQLEVAKMEPGLLKAQNDYELALEAFRKQIGAEDKNFIPEGEFILPNIPDISLDEAQEIAMQERTELELLNIATEIKQLTFNAERSNFMPNVAMNASASLYSAADGYAIKKDDFGTQYSIGIGFSIPIFTGLSNSNKISYARHDLSLAKLQEENTRDLIRLQIKQNHHKLTHAVQNYEVQEQNIRMAQRNLELAQVRFENQMGIQLEVFDAQTMLSSIKMQYIAAIYEVIAAERELTKSIGYKLVSE
ncbi:MAG: TolC family protein [Candidatus Cloacimonetes bacterium]|nr:TolC family protein [Candidatus Cloacimonadota bacterium]